MKVNQTKTVTAMTPGAPVPEPRSVTKDAAGPADKVTTDQAREVLRQIETARMSAGGARSARLRDIESAVRAGTYRPNPSRVAEEILSAAETDARLRAMLMR
jgi:anti-sigma28 factor (negative regulator of flagellin synthesis)